MSKRIQRDSVAYVKKLRISSEFKVPRLSMPSLNGAYLTVMLIREPRLEPHKKQIVFLEWMIVPEIVHFEVANDELGRLLPDNAGIELALFKKEEQEAEAGKHASSYVIVPGEWATLPYFTTITSSKYCETSSAVDSAMKFPVNSFLRVCIRAVGLREDFKLNLLGNITMEQHPENYLAQKWTPSPLNTDLIGVSIPVGYTSGISPDAVFSDPTLSAMMKQWVPLTLCSDGDEIPDEKLANESGIHLHIVRYSSPTDAVRETLTDKTRYLHFESIVTFWQWNYGLKLPTSYSLMVIPFGSSVMKDLGFADGSEVGGEFDRRLPYAANFIAAYFSRLNPTVFVHPNARKTLSDMGPSYASALFDRVADPEAVFSFATMMHAGPLVIPNFAAFLQKCALPLAPVTRIETVGLGSRPIRMPCVGDVVYNATFGGLPQEEEYELYMLPGTPLVQSEQTKLAAYMATLENVEMFMRSNSEALQKRRESIDVGDAFSVRTGGAFFFAVVKE